MFKKYDSITNHYQDKTIVYYEENGANDIWWEVTEKVHGCNFSWIVSNGQIQYAQRSMVTDSIFNSHRDTPKYDEVMIALEQHIGEPIQVYGEYYGNGIVGKGAIPYLEGKDKDFIFYDIRLITSDTFVAPDIVRYLFEKFNIPCVPLCFIGGFKQCIIFDTENLKSKVSKFDTYVEGVVLKPMEDKRLPNGDRMIIKIISPEYRENKHTPVERKSIQEQVELSILQRETRETVKNKLTDIRVGKVASKVGIGVDDKSKFQVLQRELANDIAEECEKIEGVKVDMTLTKTLCIPHIKSFFNLI